MLLAVMAGILATCGSLFGKFAGAVGSDSVIKMLFKVFLLGVMVLLNTTGCTCFVKALESSGSSLPVTIASSASNYFCSALVGYLVFGETTSWRWWCGTLLVLLGLLLVCFAPYMENNVDDGNLPSMEDKEL